jgi:predicted negative regulator of RcsB-dependent stress response
MPKKVSIKNLLRTDDAFLTTTDRAYSYYLANSKKIWLSLAIAAVLVLIGLLFKHFHDARLSKATEAFHQAAAQADPGQSAEELTKVAQDYSGTPGARQASFALVANYLAENRAAEALPVLENLSQTLTPGEQSLKPLIQSTLASLYEEGGQAERALEVYQTALELVRQSPLTPASQSFQAELLSSIGRVSLSLGRPQQAMKAYEELLGLAPDGYRAYAAQLKLAALTDGPAPGAQPPAPAASEPAPASLEAPAAASPAAPDAASPTEPDAPAARSAAPEAAQEIAPADEAAATSEPAAAAPSEPASPAADEAAAPEAEAAPAAGSAAESQSGSPAPQGAAPQGD